MSIREQQKQERRQKIIHIAKELFLERGIQNVQMQDISNTADIGIATLFRYFPKKEYLVIAATNAITDQMATDVQDIIQQSYTAYEKTEQILDYYMRSTQDPQLRLAKFFNAFDLYKKMAEESPEQYEEYLYARSNLANILLALAEQGTKDGSLRQDIDLSLFIMTMVQNFTMFTHKSSLTIHDSSLSSILTASKQLAMMKDVFLHYIRPNK